MCINTPLCLMLAITYWILYVVTELLKIWAGNRKDLGSNLGMIPYFYSNSRFTSDIIIYYYTLDENNAFQNCRLPLCINDQCCVSVSNAVQTFLCLSGSEISNRQTDPLKIPQSLETHPVIITISKHTGTNFPGGFESTIKDVQCNGLMLLVRQSSKNKNNTAVFGSYHPFLIYIKHLSDKWLIYRILLQKKRTSSSWDTYNMEHRAIKMLCFSAFHCGADIRYKIFVRYKDVILKPLTSCYTPNGIFLHIWQYWI